MTETRSIVVEEVYPHPPETVWRALTDPALMGRWMMAPAGFAPVVGQEFTFATKPAGNWDGTIACRVVEITPAARMVWSWKGGDAANQGYGAVLDSTVTFTLSPDGTGTRLRLEHAGFTMPEHAFAFEAMGKGWGQILSRLAEVVAAG